MEIKKVYLTQDQSDKLYAEVAEKVAKDLVTTPIIDVQLKYIKEYPADMVYVALFKYLSFTLTQVSSVINALNSESPEQLVIHREGTPPVNEVTLSEVIENFDA